MPCMTCVGVRILLMLLSLVLKHGKFPKATMLSTFVDKLVPRNLDLGFTTVNTLYFSLIRSFHCTRWITCLSDAFCGPDWIISLPATLLHFYRWRMRSMS